MLMPFTLTISSIKGNQMATKEIASTRIKSRHSANDLHKVWEITSQSTTMPSSRHNKPQVLYKLIIKGHYQTSKHSVRAVHVEQEEDVFIRTVQAQTVGAQEATHGL